MTCGCRLMACAAYLGCKYDQETRGGAVEKVMLLKFRQMINKIKNRIREMIRKTKSRRWYDEKDIDAYIISFPKCGRTWLRFILAQIIQKHYGVTVKDPLKLDQYARVDKRIPLIRITHEDVPHVKYPDELNDDVNAFKDKKVVFLTRDPRDIIVSFYFHQTKIDGTYQGELFEFVREECGSIRTIIRYYNIWARRMKTNDVLLVKYENMLKDCCLEIKRILNYLEIDGVPDDIVSSAVECAQFKNMRKLERKGWFSTAGFKSGNINDFESYKTRRGIAGGYVDYLTRDDIAYIDNEIERNLEEIFEYKKLS